jgi:hypothetical protein
MNVLNLVVDPYDRQARLYPALLLIAPVVITAVGLSLADFTVFQSCLALTLGFGGAFLLTQLARDAGKRRESILFEKWGGIPSVLIFRHSHPRYDSITKMRYHKQLSLLVSGAKKPSPADEKANPSAADEVYSAWSHYLRANARDIKIYPLLFQENISYGYRRNVWGLRPFGITITSLCIMVTAGRLWSDYRMLQPLSQEVVASLIISLLFFMIWVFRFNSDWVRIPADAYAERLAETLEIIAAKSSSESPKEKKTKRED